MSTQEASLATHLNIFATRQRMKESTCAAASTADRSAGQTSILLKVLNLMLLTRLGVDIATGWALCVSLLLEHGPGIPQLHTFEEYCIFYDHNPEQ